MSRAILFQLLFLLLYSFIGSLNAQNPKFLKGNGTKQDIVSVTCFQTINLEVDTSVFDSMTINAIQWFSDSLGFELNEYRDFPKVEVNYESSTYNDQRRVIVKVETIQQIPDSLNPGVFKDSVVFFHDSINFEVQHRILSSSITPEGPYTIFDEVIGIIHLNDSFYTESNRLLIDIQMIKNSIDTLVNQLVFFYDTLDDCKSRQYAVTLRDQEHKCLEATSHVGTIEAMISRPEIESDTLICPEEIILARFVNKMDFPDGPTGYTSTWFLSEQEIGKSMDEVTLYKAGKLKLKIEYTNAEGCISETPEIQINAYANKLTWSIWNIDEMDFVTQKDNTLKLCENKEIVIKAQLSDKASYKWVYPNQMVIKSDSLPFEWAKMNDSLGYLSLEAKDGKCMFEQKISIDKIPKPRGTISMDPEGTSPICAYDTATIKFVFDSLQSENRVEWQTPAGNSIEDTIFLMNPEFNFLYNGKSIQLKLALKQDHFDGPICRSDTSFSLQIAPTPIFNKSGLDTLFICPDNDFKWSAPLKDYVGDNIDSISWKWAIQGFSIPWKDSIIISSLQNLSGLVIGRVTYNSHCFDTISFQIQNELPADISLEPLNGPFCKDHPMWLIVRPPYQSYNMLIMTNASDTVKLEKSLGSNGFIIKTIPQHTILDFTLKNSQECEKSASIVIGDNCSCMESFDSIKLKAIKITSQTETEYFGLQIQANLSFFEKSRCYRWGRIRKDFSREQEIFPASTQAENVPWYPLSSLDTSNFFYWVDISFAESCELCRTRVWLGGDSAVIHGRSITVDTFQNSDPFLRVYPNPTDGNFTITISNSVEDVKWTLKLFDLAGRNLTSIKGISSNQLSSGFPISLQIGPSLIIVVATSDRGDRLVSKVIKQ